MRFMTSVLIPSSLAGQCHKCCEPLALGQDATNFLVRGGITSCGCLEVMASWKRRSMALFAVHCALNVWSSARMQTVLF